MTPDRSPSDKHQPRLILYVGKGGVGKTTVAAATAVRAAQLGHRTLVVSTDIAHSLGDVLDVELGANPQPVADNLHAQEINVLEEFRRNWGKVEAQFADLLRREGLPDIQADELAILPGMEEVASLAQIGRQSRTGNFDCIVVDAAPTGETIRLLSMPESFKWYVGLMEGWRGRLGRLAGPLLRGALPDLNVVDAMHRLADRVKELRQSLTDSRHSSYRLVVTPDRMVLKEARRAETYLNLFGYPIDAVVLNRVLALDEPDSLHVRSIMARQQKLIADVRQTFATLPLLEAPFSVDEPLGVEVLATFGQSIFGDRDPADVLHVGPTQMIERVGDGYLLRIPMPNVDVGQLTLAKRGDELFVEIGNVRREIALPRTLATLEPGQARLREGTLEISFNLA